MRYFAYGSNLDLDDVARWWRARTGEPPAGSLHPAGLRPWRAGWLADHEPVFHYYSEARAGGALSVRRRVGSATAGALMEVDTTALGWLDEKEGHPSRYERLEVDVLDARGEVHAAFTYVVTPRHRRAAHVRPTASYLAVVRRGLARFEQPSTLHDAAAVSLATPSFPRRVFVYGTLLRGEERAALIADQRPASIEPASIDGALVDLGPYPGLVRLGEGGTVHGELIRLDDASAALAALDEVEDFLGYRAEGSLYHRVLVWAETRRGERELAWTYRYVGAAPGAPIPSGDWRRR